MIFPSLGIVTPTDELIFFRGVGIPPTRKYGICSSMWDVKHDFVLPCLIVWGEKFFMLNRNVYYAIYAIFWGWAPALASEKIVFSNSGF